ncbi:Tetratricopeptide repeat protein 17 [Labeo rohita]|uniref:Tetratricopeptide repeat protein 17 n=1 Tax=Labeo rohita TaxID=84645 RepID=A0ABQ8LME5_LABRO|nr:Tetratricopeptide repeat protein 17 [Labeo rohita]
MELATRFASLAQILRGTSVTPWDWREATIRCLESIWPRSRTLLNLEHSPTLTHCVEQQPLLNGARQQDKVRDTASEHALVDNASERKGLEESPTHCTICEGEIQLDSGDLIDCNMDIFVDMPVLLPPSSELPACPELSVCPKLSACPEMTTEVVPLSAALPVLGVVMWCLDLPPTLPLLHPPILPSPCCFSSTTAASCWPLCSPSAHHLCIGIATGLPVSIGIVPGGSLVSTSMAPSSLLSTMARQSTSSAGIPRLSSSALVSHRPSATSGLPSPATPCPSRSDSLLLPFGSTLVLCCSSSTVAFQIPTSALVSAAICSTFALPILPITLAHRLSISASGSTTGSTTTCSTTVSRPSRVVSPSSTMALPSIGSTVGHHHGCVLGPAWPSCSKSLLSSPWLLLFSP